MLLRLSNVQRLRLFRSAAKTIARQTTMIYYVSKRGGILPLQMSLDIN